MQSLQESDKHALARLLRHWMASHAPDWTDANDSDPGVTLLQLFAFVVESLLADGAPLSEHARLSAARLARCALLLAGDDGRAQSGPLVRNRYFSGRLLTAEDFQLEQDYLRGRLRRHNRVLHGAGIVHGLQVSVRSGSGSTGVQVVVQPGFAIAPDGEEVEVRSEISADIPEDGTRLCVTLSSAERFTHPVPVSDEEQAQFTRIEGTYSLRVGATPDVNGVVLARLLLTTTGWEIAKSC
jgi:hypothetical protein